jgi:uncharacterized protein YjiS (DUF1127 family)
MTTSHGWAPFSRITETFALWRQRDRERVELAQMMDTDLRELGLTRATLEYELRKPFWRG